MVMPYATTNHAPMHRGGRPGAGSRRVGIGMTVKWTSKESVGNSVHCSPLGRRTRPMGLATTEEHLRGGGP